MSVAPRPIVTEPYPPRKAVASARSKKHLSKNSPDRRQRSISGKSTKKVEKLPVRSPFNLPIWLRSLLLLQQSSLGVFFFLIAAIFSVYGFTVGTQQLWNKEYKKLKTLQRHERMLTETNETLKNNLAKQAEKSGNGLVPVNPNKSIFLHRFRDNSLKSGNSQATNSTQTIPIKPPPSAY